MHKMHTIVLNRDAASEVLFSYVRAAKVPDCGGNVSTLMIEENGR